MGTKKTINELDEFPTAEEVEDKIAELGVKYTARIWKLLQAADITLKPYQADIYHIIQQAHLRFTGHSLPATIKGARKTKAQIRDATGPEIKEEVIEQAVQGGLAARLKQMRENKNG